MTQISNDAQGTLRRKDKRGASGPSAQYPEQGSREAVLNRTDKEPHVDDGEPAIRNALAPIIEDRNKRGGKERCTYQSHNYRKLNKEQLILVVGQDKIKAAKKVAEATRVQEG